MRALASLPLLGLATVLALIACDDGLQVRTDLDNDGYLSDEDCVDIDAAIHPGADEVCDEIDNDCDGDVDESPIDGITAWADADGDGFGDPGAPIVYCVWDFRPADTVHNNQDCDDADAGMNPGAIERCGDRLDNDCDGEIDEAADSDAPEWYPDTDGDGFGRDGGAIQSCTQPDGYAAQGGDCDDTDHRIHPDARERTGNAVDENCNGSTRN